MTRGRMVDGREFVVGGVTFVLVGFALVPGGGQVARARLGLCLMESKRQPKAIIAGQRRGPGGARQVGKNSGLLASEGSLV